MRVQRVCIIGLDCLSPDLVFGAEPDRLPALTRLRDAGLWGRMASTVPPITVPAWTAMVTGLDPGMLGVYGFRDRAAFDYGSRRLSSSLAVQAPTIWALASRAGIGCRIIGVPQTYPPKPLRGVLVSDAPDGEAAASFTYPPELRAEVERVAGGDLFGIADHRHAGLDELAATVRAVTERRFRLARAWLAESDWRLFMLVDMGPDRLQHAFWRYHDPAHPRHEPGHRYASVVRDYYRDLDREIAALVDRLGPEDVALVVSDHGVQASLGGLALNEWLIEQGYLVLAPGEQPSSPTPLASLRVDWRRTRAWADGGFAGRIYFNICGREPEGALLPGDCQRLAGELERGLACLRGPGGAPVRITVHRPAVLYRELRGHPPDMLVEIDAYARRALGAVGHGQIWPADNDTGRDDANHATHGVFIMRDGGGGRPAPSDLSIYDVAPTVLDRLGVPAPGAMIGQVRR